MGELELTVEALSVERNCLGLDRHHRRYWLLGPCNETRCELAVFVQQPQKEEEAAAAGEAGFRVTATIDVRAQVFESLNYITQVHLGRRSLVYDNQAVRWKYVGEAFTRVGALLRKLIVTCRVRVSIRFRVDASLRELTTH